MLELFVMSLHEYWGDTYEDARKAENAVDELKSVLTTYYGKDVDWCDEVEFHEDDDEEDLKVTVDTIDDNQISVLHLVTAKLELDGTLDGMDFDPEFPDASEILDRLEDEIDDHDVERFPHLMSIGNSHECIVLPVDLPHMTIIDTNEDECDECEYDECEYDECECDECDANDDDAENDDHECGCHDHECGCHDHECGCHNHECGCHNHECGCHDHGCGCHDHGCGCHDHGCGCGGHGSFEEFERLCCEMDDGSSDISSAQALRRELDDMAAHLGIDPAVDIVETHLTFSEDDPLHGAKVAWYVLSSRVNESIAKGLPLIIRFNDEDYDDLDNLE